LETLGFGLRRLNIVLSQTPTRPAHAFELPVLRKNGLRSLWVATVFYIRGRSKPSDLI